MESRRRRQEGATFDAARPERSATDSLNDLAGGRVLAFPRRRLGEAGQRLGERFPSWPPDRIGGSKAAGEPLVWKYYGYCKGSAEFERNSIARSEKFTHLIRRDPMAEK